MPPHLPPHRSEQADGLAFDEDHAKISRALRHSALPRRFKDIAVIMKLVKPLCVVSAIALFAATQALAQTPPEPPAPEAKSEPSAQQKVEADKSRKKYQQCVQPTRREVDIELKNSRFPAGPEIVTPSYFLPLGGTLHVAVREKFDPERVYFGFIEFGRFKPVFLAFGRSRIRASALTDESPLVVKKLAQAGETGLTLRLPEWTFAAWGTAALYIYQCNGSPFAVSQLTSRVSSAPVSGVAALALIALALLIAMFALRGVDRKKGIDRPLLAYANPVYLTAGSDGRGSLSKLQIVFFTLIVFGLVAFIMLRTGLLTEISSEILVLLGIAGVGSTASKGADLQKNRLDSDNWGWLVERGWLPKPDVANRNNAQWKDIFTSEGEFDVYRYQSFIFSLTVGGALIVAGINDLSSFSIPVTLLGILGLSQAVYVGGKLVTPTSLSDLNKTVSEIRDLEKKHAVAKADSARAADGTVSSLEQALAEKTNTAKLMLEAALKKY